MRDTESHRRIWTLVDYFRSTSVRWIPCNAKFFHCPYGRGNRSIRFGVWSFLIRTPGGTLSLSYSAVVEIREARSVYEVFPSLSQAGYTIHSQRPGKVMLTKDMRSIAGARSEFARLQGLARELRGQPIAGSAASPRTRSEHHPRIRQRDWFLLELLRQHCDLWMPRTLAFEMHRRALLCDMPWTVCLKIHLTARELDTGTCEPVSFELMSSISLWSPPLGEDRRRMVSAKWRRRVGEWLAREGYDGSWDTKGEQISGIFWKDLASVQTAVCEAQKLSSIPRRIPVT